MSVAQWVEERPDVSPLDCTLAGVVGLAVALSTLDVANTTIALLLVAAASLAWRRIHPTASAVVVLGSVLSAWVGASSTVGTTTAGTWTLALGGAVLAISTFSLAAWGERRLVPVALLSSLAAGVIAGVLVSGLALTSAVVLGVVAACLSWTAGQWRRSQLRYLAAVIERARRAEHEAEQAEQLATVRERTRIARELHDVIAHSLAVMTAQADGARFVLRSAPDQAEGALRAIADTGRAASSDMAGLLGMLSDRPAASAPGVVARAPQPRLADLPQLVDDLGSAGLEVHLGVEGIPVDLSPATEIAVYRVVQEALTNVLKHAPSATRADVRLNWSEARLDVRIDNDGCDAGCGHGEGARAPVPAVPSGRGLRGMRERLEHQRGRVDAGPRSDGGFAVHATLPLDRTASS